MCVSCFSASCASPAAASGRGPLVCERSGRQRAANGSAASALLTWSWLKRRTSPDVISAQRVFDGMRFAGEALSVLVFAPRYPDLAMIFKGLEGAIRCALPCPSPPLVPVSISLIMCYYGVLFSSDLICVAGRPLALFSADASPSNIILLCPGSPLSFEKGSRVFKMWTGSRAIQGVSNASRSARLLNAKQTVEQIKIKGSRLARCPHMPGAAVTVNHGSAASMLIVASIPPSSGEGGHFYCVGASLWQRCTLAEDLLEPMERSLPLGLGGYGEEVCVLQVSPEDKIDVVKSASP